MTDAFAMRSRPRAIEGAFTTLPGKNGAGVDPYCLRRISVKSWTAGHPSSGKCSPGSRCPIAGSAGFSVGREPHACWAGAAEPILLELDPTARRTRSDRRRRGLQPGSQCRPVSVTTPRASLRASGRASRNASCASARRARARCARRFRSTAARSSAVSDRCSAVLARTATRPRKRAARSADRLVP